MLVEGRKAHRCCACGTLFAFPADLNVGGSRKGPDWDAFRDAVVRVQTIAIEAVPCPQCAQMQPEMAAAVRTGMLQTASLLFAVAGVALLVLRFLSVGSSLAFLLGLAFPLCALLTTLLVLRRPVRGLDIGETVERGVVTPRPGRKECKDFSARPLVGPLALISLALLAFVSTALFVPLTGAIENPGWTPSYFGPGDTAEIVLPEPVTSLDGRWRGSAHARLVGVNDEDLVGIDDLDVVPLVRPWDEKRIVTQGHREAAPRFRVTFPANPELAGRRVKLLLGGGITYPVQAADAAFAVQEEVIDATMLVGFSRAGLGGAFHGWWQVVSVLGVVFTVAGLWTLTVAVRRRRYHERGWFKTDQPPPGATA